MTPLLFAFPQKAAFGRMVSKEAIYRHSTLSTAVKELFVRQVERITWQYKLAPETINIPATFAAPEIQVFSVQLRQEDYSPEILTAIDRVVQFPILFELCYQERVQYAAAWKRPANALSTEMPPEKWIMSAHFFGPWLAMDSPRMPLPHALNLEALYAALISPLPPFEAREDEGLAERIVRIEAIQKLQIEIARGEEKLRREKQFNKKIGINNELRQLRQHLSILVNITD
jgi:hypothetical protein